MSKGVLTRDAGAKYGPIVLMIAGLIFAKKYTNHKEEEYRSFHNKSALYGGRDLKPGERIW